MRRNNEFNNQGDRKMLKYLLIAGIILAVAYVATGRDHRAAEYPKAAITELNRDPNRYYGQRVSVTGKVVAAGGIAGSGAFWLRDPDNSELMIVTSHGEKWWNWRKSASPMGAD
jgi:hypothetical protein